MDLWGTVGMILDGVMINYHVIIKLNKIRSLENGFKIDECNCWESTVYVTDASIKCVNNL